MTRLAAFTRGACLSLVVPCLLRAQAPVASTESAAVIRDNSFLVEEAYNQDARSVQHINTFTHATTGGDWVYSFTQEWAVRGQRNQLSVTVPMSRVDGDPRASWGVGDVALNYRYQVAGVEGGRVAVAPRLSLLLPTGRASAGLGGGALGVQAMLPVSVELGDALVLHLNAGASRAGSAALGTGPATAVTLAQSVVWLAAARVNLLMETAWTSTSIPTEGSTEGTTRTLVVSPGVRWSYDLPRHLQVVPGVAFPIGVGPSAGDRAVFLYLSFEHPY